MALIKCPECGQDISDKAKKCINCGKVLIEDVVPVKQCVECGKEVPADAQECPFCGCPLEETNGSESKLKRKKTIIISAIAVAAVAIIAIVAVIFLRPKEIELNKDEALAYQNVLDVKHNLKDPDSFKLYDELTIIKHHNEYGYIDFKYTIFKYGGTNGYGAVITNEAIYKDNQYIMNYADEPDKDDANYREQLSTQDDLELFLSGEVKWEKIDIDINKIKEKMELD